MALARVLTAEDTEFERTVANSREVQGTQKLGLVNSVLFVLYASAQALLLQNP
jgi:hypothetical protein